MVVTGAFEIGGGIATVNRMVMQAIHSRKQNNYQIDVLALLEHGNSLTRCSAQINNMRYQCFAGNRIQFVLAAWRKLLVTRYEWVYCDLVNVAIVLAPWALARLCRYVVWLHGMEVFAPLPNWEGHVGLRAAWKCLASSRFTRDSVLKRYPYLPVIACDLGLDPNKYGVDVPMLYGKIQRPLLFKSAGGSEGLLGKQVILHVGRMVLGEQYKGQDVLIRTMPGILKEYPGAQLVLAGYGDDMARLLNLTQSMPREVQLAVFMPGFVPDDELDELYRHCYLFAMPSRGEGFGLVYLEAMRWAKPCIGSRLDAAQFLIHHNETGLLVSDPTSPEEVGQAIKRLLCDEEMAIKMGETGYHLLKQRYLFRHFMERFWRAIEE